MDRLLKIKEEFKNLKKQEIQNILTKNELEKACFQHDMAYGDFKDLARTAASDNVLRNKVFNIAKNPKHDGYQRRQASMVYKFFDKNSKGSGVNIPLESVEESLKELHKPIIRKFKKSTVFSGVKDNIWGAD